MKPYFDRLFFAVLPDAQTAVRIESVALRFVAEHGIRERVAAANRFHVSLNLFGDYRDGLSSEEVARASALAHHAAETVSIAPFQVSLDKIETFQRKDGRNQPLVMGVDRGRAQLRTLLLALVSGTHGMPAAKKTAAGFNPHLTLLYGNQTVMQPMEEISWVVRDFVLIHSLVGRTQYKILGRWLLRAHTGDLFGE